MGALITVGRITAKSQQRTTNVMPGRDSGVRIAKVITKHVPTHWQFVLRAQTQQMPRQVIVIRAARILHGHTHGMLTGVLTRCHWRNINADELTDIPRQCGSCTAAGFFSDREQGMTVNLRLLAAFHNRLQGGQQCRDARFIVQMTGTDMPAFRELRQRIERNKIANINAYQLGSHRIAAGCVLRHASGL